MVGTRGLIHRCTSANNNAVTVINGFGQPPQTTVDGPARLWTYEVAKLKPDYIVSSAPCLFPTLIQLRGNQISFVFLTHLGGPC
jgi:hypothetical protein